MPEIQLTAEKKAEYLERLHNPRWVRTHPAAARLIERLLRNVGEGEITPAVLKGLRICPYCSPHVTHNERCSAPLLTLSTSHSSVRTCSCLGDGTRTPSAGIVRFRKSQDDIEERKEMQL